MDVGNSAAQGAHKGAKIFGIAGALVVGAFAVAGVIAAGTPILAALAAVAFYTAIGGITSAISGAMFGAVLGGIVGLFKSKQSAGITQDPTPQQGGRPTRSHQHPTGGDDDTPGNQTPGATPRSNRQPSFNPRAV